MKAIYFDGKNLHLESTYPCPEPKTGEVLIRIERAGICDTDLQILAGYMNFRGVLGHECVGQVVAADNSELNGRRVVAEINNACGSCPTCLQIGREHCPSRSVLGIMNSDGVFAEFAALASSTLRQVPDNVSAERAVFTEPLAAALEITQQAHIRPRDRVLVLGDGKLGSLIVQVVNLTGCQLTLLGRHASKTDPLHKVCPNVRACLLPSELEPRSFDIVIEAGGRPDGVDLALSLVRPRGTILLKSTVSVRNHNDLNMIVIDEITLIGSRCGPFEPALRLLETGLIRTDFLIEAIVPLSLGEEAFRLARQKGAKKVIIDTTR